MLRNPIRLFSSKFRKQTTPTLSRETFFGDIVPREPEKEVRKLRNVENDKLLEYRDRIRVENFVIFEKLVFVITSKILKISTEQIDLKGSFDFKL